MIKAAACGLIIAVLFLTASEPSKKDFWKGTSGGFEISWSASNLLVKRSADGKVVLDAAAHAKADWHGIASKLGSQPAEAQDRFRLLSVFGPYLTVEESRYCDCGGAHPTETLTFESIDLEKSSLSEWKPASLTSIFSEEQVLQALNADSVIKKALGSAPPQSSLSGLWHVLQDKTAKVEDCEFSFDSDLLQHFALYNVQADWAMIRLSLAPDAEVCRGQIAQLGLKLSLPAKNILAKNNDWFQAVQHRREGLLMIDASHMGEAASTTFTFKH